MEFGSFSDNKEHGGQHNPNINNIQYQQPVNNNISLITVKPMSFKDSNQKSSEILKIHSDISHFQFLKQSGNTLECIFFQMNGENVQLNLQENSTILNGKYPNHQLIVPSEKISSKVIISGLKTGDSKQAVCLADGRILTGIENFQLKNSQFYVLDQLEVHKFKSFFMMAYFSYESVNEIEDSSQFYLLGVEYSGDAVVQYKSDNESMKNNIKTIIPLQNTRFAAYDELNQILLLLDVNLKLTFFRYQNNKLEMKSFEISQADLSMYGLKDFSKILAFDFQFQADIFNIYIGSAESILLFCYSLNPQSQTARTNKAEKILIFNHKKTQDSSPFTSLFADKRIQSFKAQNITLIYEKSIIIACLKDLTMNKIANLKKSSQPSFIRKYFCIYGKGSKTYHFYTSSTVRSIKDDTDAKQSLNVCESIP